jgi:hypothetical protein
VTLPTIYQRAEANPELVKMYNGYKMANLGVHATMASASWGFTSFESPRRLRAARFALAGYMVLVMARQVDRLLELGWGDGIGVAEQRFMAEVKPGAR